MQTQLIVNNRTPYTVISSDASGCIAYAGRAGYLRKVLRLRVPHRVAICDVVALTR